MPSFRGIRVTRTNGYGAGRGDNPHHDFSALKKADEEDFGIPSLDRGRMLHNMKNKRPDDIGTKWAGADKMTFGDETPDTTQHPSRLGAGGKLLPGLHWAGPEHDEKF